MVIPHQLMAPIPISTSTPYSCSLFLLPIPAPYLSALNLYTLSPPTAAYRENYLPNKKAVEHMAQQLYRSTTLSLAGNNLPRTLMNTHSSLSKT